MSQPTDDVDAHMENTSPITNPVDPLAAFGSDMSPPASQSAEIPAAANSEATRSQPSRFRQAQVLTHVPSGYLYTREEDAPGYLWKNKRAQEEFHRAMRDVDAKNVVVGSMSNSRSISILPAMLTSTAVRYGDPALVADPKTPWDKII